MRKRGINGGGGEPSNITISINLIDICWKRRYPVSRWMDTVAAAKHADSSRHGYTPTPMRIRWGRRPNVSYPAEEEAVVSRCANLRCLETVDCLSSGMLIAVPLSKSQAAMFLWLCPTCSARIHTENMRLDPSLRAQRVGQATSAA